MSDAPDVMVGHYREQERQRILDMKPGPEMDAEVAEKVMGKTRLTVEEAVERVVDSSVRIHNSDGIFIDYEHNLMFDKEQYDELFSHGHYIPHYRKWLNENSTIRFTPKRYTTDISAAWEVVEKMNSKSGFSLGRAGDYEQDRKWNVRIGTHEWEEADTAPEAICKAALLAMNDDLN